MGVALVFGLVASKTEPKCFVTELSDGTKVYMKVSKDYLKKDKDMRRAALRIDQRERVVSSNPWID
jgi:hypothetical protein